MAERFTENTTGEIFLISDLYGLYIPIFSEVLDQRNVYTGRTVQTVVLERWQYG